MNVYVTACPWFTALRIRQPRIPCSTWCHYRYAHAKPETRNCSMTAIDHREVSSTELARLWVFDFDWTVVDENSDTWIHQCAPNGSLPSAVKDSYVPPDWIGYMNRVLGYLANQGVTPGILKSQLQTIPWTPGMRQLLQAIANSCIDVAPTTATPKLPEMEAAPTVCGQGVARAINTFCQTDASEPPGTNVTEQSDSVSAALLALGLRHPQHAVILSDANSLFIPWILDNSSSDANDPHREKIDTCGGVDCNDGKTAHAATGPVGDAGASADADVRIAQVSKSLDNKQRRTLSAASFLRILTNPATVDGSSGALIVSPHHGPGPDSAASPHACSRCHPNLCKRTALQALLDEQAAGGVSYKQIVYVGDGRNDLCPCLGLRECDVAMPRVGFALHKLLAPMVASEATVTDAGNAGQATTRSASTATAATSSSAHGDDHVYGATSGDVVPKQSCGLGKCTSAGEKLLAACVPWRDAFDILLWASQQSEQDAPVDGLQAVSL